MKTAEDLFNDTENWGEAWEYFHDCKVIPLSTAIELAKLYANAKLDEAAEGATVIEGECGEFGEYIPTVVDKESILKLKDQI